MRVRLRLFASLENEADSDADDIVRPHTAGVARSPVELRDAKGQAMGDANVQAAANSEIQHPVLVMPVLVMPCQPPQSKFKFGTSVTLQSERPHPADDAPVHL